LCGSHAELAAKRPGGMSEYYKRELANSEAIHEAAMKAATEAVAATASPSNGSTAAPSSKSSSLLTEEERRAADMAAHGPRAEAEIAAEASKALGRNVTVNEEGQIVDKRELLTGGLNLLPRKAVQGPAGGPPKGFALSIAERRSAQDEVQRKEAERKKREDEASLGMTGLTMAERQKLSRERQSKELERQMLLAQEKKRKAEEEKSSDLERKVKAKRNDETKIEELKRKALERRMQKKQQEEEAAQATSAGQSKAA
jgi:coiled-coil domain-containing protein 55